MQEEEKQEKLSKQNIISKELNTQELKSNVFQQICDDETIVFASLTTKNCLKEYISGGSQEKKLAKNLWKNLLKDAICLLKINDRREKLYQNTKELYKQKQNRTTFNEKFDKIRHSSSYGIEELSDYFDDFVEFESVLYGTEEFYRDHIYHVLHVWGIGISLLWGSEKIALELTENFKVDKADFHFDIEEGEKEKKISRSELWAMWTIIALCHDLGYPLEKSSQINQKVKKIVNHFGCFNFHELNFNFDILNTFVVEKFLNIISSKTLRNNDKESESSNVCSNKCSDTCWSEFSNHKTEIQHKYRDKFSKSIEDYKHGSLSGLLLFKKLTYFLETDFAQERKSLNCEDLRQFYIRKEILRAICCHTCPKIYHLELKTLPFLLILCDEVQEWGRPRFEEILSGSSSKECVKINIKRFTTENEKTIIHIYSQYDLPIKKMGLENIEKNIVKRKFKNLHYLLRSAKDDQNRRIKFTWEILLKEQSGDKTYIFTFESDKNAYEMFKTTRTEGEQTTDFDMYSDDENVADR